LPLHKFNIIFASRRAALIIKTQIMKLKLTLIFALSVFSTTLFAQTAKKGQLFGLHYNMSDFNSPTSLKDASTGKGYSKAKDMNKGFSLSYWRGLTSKVDLAVKANVVFRDFSAIYQGTTGKTEIGIELEPTVNLRLFPDAAKLAPFLTTGVGVGMYNDKFGGYIPVGGGIQFNMQSETYLFLQAQYKYTLTKKVLGDNLFYSIGFAQKF
jgi:OmpA-OmpF porin, OOP family